jgi:hypothetical protein
MRRIGRLRRAMVAAIPVGLGILTGLTVVPSVRGGLGAEEVVELLVITVVCGIPAVAIFLGHGFVNPARVARLMARSGLCAGCGAGLSDVETGSDGCAVCSECGSAWRIEGGGRARVGTPPDDRPHSN